MTTRQEKILKLIVEEYTKKAFPVGSSTLADLLGLSSATIRNEMVELEKGDYIYQPHTSAGRIPSDKGYRYYVNLLMGDKSLSPGDQRKLQADLLKMRAQYKKMARVTAKLLALHSQNAVLTGVLEKDEYATSGLNELVKMPEFGDVKEIAKIFEAIDHFDETVDVYLEDCDKGHQVKTYIGEENPIEAIQSCSLIVSDFKLPSGERGVVAVLGPKRMKYGKNISLVSYITKLLSGGTMILLISNFQFQIFN